MRPVVAEVVATKRFHCHRVAAHHAHLANHGGRGFRGDAGADKHAMLPVLCFVHERREFLAPAAENNRRDRHSLGRIHEARAARIVACIDGKSRVRMRGRTGFRIVGTTLPVERRLTHFLILPPRLVVRRSGDIREDRIVVDHVERVLVGFLIRPGDNAEVPGLRVDSTHAALFVQMQPRDVVAERPDLPAR